MFITFEGIDGCGKTTQIELFEKYLKEQKFRVLTTREPGGTEFAEKCRDLLHEYGNKISPYTQAFLMSTGRRDHYEKVLKPNLELFDFIICDRYIDSTVAYQIHGQKLTHEFIYTLITYATEILIPDLTFFLDIDPKLALERINNRNQKDYFDNEKVEFFESVRNGYKKLSNFSKAVYKNQSYNRYITIDASKNPNEVHKEITTKFEHLLESLFNSYKAWIKENINLN